MAKIISRRHLVAGVSTLVPSLLYNQQKAAAASPVDAGEAIRRSAANLPGFGPSDVFYPVAWSGTWNMRREVLQESSPPLVLEYKVRFLSSIEDNAVVADRGFNQMSLESALRGKADAVQSCDWKISNPNDLRLTMSDGSRKEVKVTKRATEMSDTNVFSSEFQRVTVEDAANPIPSISARRVLTKWKIVDEGTLEGLEIVYDVSSGGDPLSAQSLQSQQKVLSKSRLLLRRTS